MDLFLGFEQHLALLVFAALDGFVDDALGFFFGAADLLLSDLFAIGHAEDKEDHAADDQAACDAKEEGYQIKVHNLRTHLLFISIGLRMRWNQSSPASASPTAGGRPYKSYVILYRFRCGVSSFNCAFCPSPCPEIHRISQPPPSAAAQKTVQFPGCGSCTAQGVKNARLTFDEKCVRLRWRAAPPSEDAARWSRTAGSRPRP